jgi:hypothetical protein
VDLEEEKHRGLRKIIRLWRSRSQISTPWPSSCSSRSFSCGGVVGEAWGGCVFSVCPGTVSSSFFISGLRGVAFCTLPLSFFAS